MAHYTIEIYTLTTFEVDVSAEDSDQAIDKGLELFYDYTENDKRSNNIIRVTACEVNEHYVHPKRGPFEE